MRTSNTVYVSVKGTKGHETAKAINFTIDEISGEPINPPVNMWIPISQIQKITSDKNVVGNDTLVVAEWILEKKGLI